MDNINFKARYISNKYSVKAWSQATNTYRNKKVRLVQLDYQSDNDYAALKTLSKLWSGEDNFIDAILAKFYYVLHKKDAPKSDIYLLTSQKKAFKQLDAKKILGIAEVTTIGKTSSFDYLQSRPDSTFGKQGRKFKGIGDVLTKFVTKNFGRNNLYGRTIEDKIAFYERHGFVVTQRNLINPLIKYKPETLKNNL